jgi:hypothetical protein
MIWIQGQKAGAPSRSDPWPHPTAAPSASASPASRIASVLLPIPGSPVTSTTRRDPPSASAKAARNSPSSTDRPTKAAPGETTPPVLTCLNVDLRCGPRYARRCSAPANAAGPHHRGRFPAAVCRAGRDQQIVRVAVTRRGLPVSSGGPGGLGLGFVGRAGGRRRRERTGRRGDTGRIRRAAPRHSRSLRTRGRRHRPAGGQRGGLPRPVVGNHGRHPLAPPRRRTRLDQRALRGLAWAMVDIGARHADTPSLRIQRPDWGWGQSRQLQRAPATAARTARAYRDSPVLRAHMQHQAEVTAVSPTATWAPLTSFPAG